MGHEGVARGSEKCRKVGEMSESRRNVGKVEKRRHQPLQRPTPPVKTVHTVHEKLLMRPDIIVTCTTGGMVHGMDTGRTRGEVTPSGCAGNIWFRGQRITVSMERRFWGPAGTGGMVSLVQKDHAFDFPAAAER